MNFILVSIKFYPKAKEMCFTPDNPFFMQFGTAVLKHFVYRTIAFGPYDLVFMQLALAFNGWQPFWNKVYTLTQFAKIPCKVSLDNNYLSRFKCVQCI